MYRVFLGGPSRSFLLSDNSQNATYEWRNVSSTSTALSNQSSTAAAIAEVFTRSTSVLMPHDAYEAASARISEFYQNTIFHDDDDDEAGDYSGDAGGQTTIFTWPPTALSTKNRKGDADESTSTANLAIPSFLIHESTTCEQETPPSSPFDTSLSQTQISQSRSYSRLDASHSIAHFPSFHFNPNTLSSLSLLSKAPRKVNLLVAVLEVDGSGSDTVKIKNGPDAGKEVAVLRMIVGDEDGRVAKMTAWREVAEIWGGMKEGSVGVKRGDVVLIENVNGSRDAQTSPALTASPHLGSKMTICYRTLPRANSDQRLRPDLRLGASDAGVRKVADVVRWFEHMAGL